MDRAYIPFRTKCIIKSCATNYCAICLKNTKTYHEVPTRSREQWLLLCERKDLLCSINSHRHIHICSNHFRDNDYYPQPFRLRLFKDAAPSRNLQAALCSHVDDSYFVQDEQTSQQSTSLNQVSSCLLEPLQKVKEEQPGLPFSEELNLSHGETEKLQQTAMAEHYLETVTPNVAVADIEMVVVKEEREDKVENGGEHDSIPVKTEPPAWEEPNVQSDGEEELCGIDAGSSCRRSSLAETFTSCPLASSERIDSSQVSSDSHAESNSLPGGNSGENSFNSYAVSASDTDVTNNEESSSRPFLFRCSHCPYGADSKGYLRKHLVVHKPNREKPFACNQCQYSTDRKGLLKRHVLTHEKDKVKPYACNYCEFRFEVKQGLLRHLLTHTNNRVKPYSCDQCDYRTDVSANLQTHLLTHDTARVKTFACDFCQYRSNRRSDLQLHIVTHEKNRVKPYACEHCEYRAHRKGHLQSHQRVHVSNHAKLFQCCMCDYKTDYKNSLKQHFRTHLV